MQIIRETSFDETISEYGALEMREGLLPEIAAKAVTRATAIANVWCLSTFCQSDHFSENQYQKLYVLQIKFTYYSYCQRATTSKIVFLKVFFVVKIVSKV